MLEITSARMNTCLKLHFPENLFPEFTRARSYIWSKSHFPENLFSRNYISSEIHFLETIFLAKNYSMFMLFNPNKQNERLVEIKKRSDNS